MAFPIFISPHVLKLTPNFPPKFTPTKTQSRNAEPKTYLSGAIFFSFEY